MWWKDLKVLSKNHYQILSTKLYKIELLYGLKLIKFKLHEKFLVRKNININQFNLNESFKFKTDSFPLCPMFYKKIVN